MTFAQFNFTRIFHLDANIVTKTHQSFLQSMDDEFYWILLDVYFIV